MDGAFLHRPPCLFEDLLALGRTVDDHPHREIDSAWSCSSPCAGWCRRSQCSTSSTSCSAASGSAGLSVSAPGRDSDRIHTAANHRINAAAITQPLRLISSAKAESAATVAALTPGTVTVNGRIQLL